MKYIVTVNGKKYEVEVEEAALSTASASAVPQPASNPVPTTAKPEAQKATEAAVEGGEAVKAPMPGTILEIRVSPGQSVKKGDVLFILEAMKMENEIMSGADGVVAAVSTSKGTMVNTGDTLAILNYK